MANIRKESGRHKWKYQKVGVRGRHYTKEMWLCTNCGMSHDEEKFGVPASDGCIYDVDMIKLGRSRMDDHEEFMYKGTGSYAPELLSKKN